MMRDSMEFFDVYRSRLQDAGVRGSAYRSARTVRILARPEWPAPVSRTLFQQRKHLLPLFCGRLLTVSGHLLLSVGKRLSACSTASDQVVSRG